MILTEEQIKEIEKKIGYEFRYKRHLEIAFTRSSYAEEAKIKGEDVISNEVFEFYGDSVLNYIVVDSVSIFRYRDIDGVSKSRTQEELTNYVSFWTDKTMLSSKIQELGISKYLIMSEGDKKNNVQNNISAQEDLFEAIIGAIWFDTDKDLKIIKNVVYNLLDLDTDEVCFQKNPFTVLKEFIDKHPIYKASLELESENKYIFSLSNDVKTLFKTKIKAYSKHVAQARGALEAISYLKEKGLWNGNKEIVEVVVDMSNSINKLQELYQKKIIPSPATYEFEFSYIEDEWICRCQVPDGTICVQQASLKSDAKKLAAIQAYKHIMSTLKK